MFEVYFLWVLALVWLIFAVVEDFRKSEISNWLNYSLIIFAIGFRLFYSLFGGDFNFLYQGLIGLGIFWVLSNLFYYMRLYAGGDYRLMVALGAILPLGVGLGANLKFFLMYLFLFFIVGAIYGLTMGIYFGVKNFSKMKKKFLELYGESKGILITSLVVACLFLILSFVNSLFFALGIFIFVLPYLYLFFKAVDDGCMIKKVKPSKLTEGDWLFEDVKVGKKFIKATWNGLEKKDIKLLQKKKFVFVRYGIQYGIVFLVSFVLWMFLSRMSVYLF